MKQLRQLTQDYPPQFWLMFTGMLISTVGSSMIWPFLMIFFGEKLNLSQTTTSTLLTINSAAMIVSSFLGGPVVDRFGRKWVMVIGLFLNGLIYFFYSQANSYLYFSVLMVIAGIVAPLFRIGADAMLADLVKPDKRIGAYAYMRLSHNLGIAIGPILGGFMAATSNNLVFYGAAIGMVIYSLLVFSLARETIPQFTQPPPTGKVFNQLESYAPVFKDRAFMVFFILFTMVTVCAVLIWILLPVHAIELYHVTKQAYGFIPTTNAVLVVTLQILVTALTRRFSPFLLMAIGTLFYALADGTIAVANNLTGFWIGMVIMTFGELILMPNASTYVANLAPAEMRGRYMSLFGLSWSLASGIAPVAGSILKELINPQATWLGGMVIGLIAMVGFYRLKHNSISATQTVKAD